MAREFGLYPETSVPHYWIGCRAIITRNGLEIPYDRWSSDFRSTARKQELIDFVNGEAAPKLERIVRQHRTNGYFDSEDGKFRCEYDTRNSGGYLYCGFYSLTVEPGDEVSGE